MSLRSRLTGLAFLLITSLLCLTLISEDAQAINKIEATKELKTTLKIGDKRERVTVTGFNRTHLTYKHEGEAKEQSMPFSELTLAAAEGHMKRMAGDSYLRWMVFL